MNFTLLIDKSLTIIRYFLSGEYFLVAIFPNKGVKSKQKISVLFLRNFELIYTYTFFAQFTNSAKYKGVYREGGAVAPLISGFYTYYKPSTQE